MKRSRKLERPIIDPSIDWRERTFEKIGIAIAKKE